MARTDRFKEELGWLKVPLGLPAVIGASLPGWLAQSYTKSNPILVVAATVVAGGIFQINRIAYRLIDNLKES